MLALKCYLQNSDGCEMLSPVLSGLSDSISFETPLPKQNYFLCNLVFERQIYLKYIRVEEEIEIVT